MSEALARFADPEALVSAVRAAREAGFHSLEAFSPHPIDELHALLPGRETTVSWTVFVAAALGALAGYLLQFYTAVVVYPFDVGGTPHHSWPAFLPITFECGVLAGALAAILSVLFWSGLPRFHHPVFRAGEPAPHFAVRADGYLLRLEGNEARRFLADRGGVIHEE